MTETNAVPQESMQGLLKTIVVHGLLSAVSTHDAHRLKHDMIHSRTIARQAFLAFETLRQATQHMTITEYFSIPRRVESVDVRTDTNEFRKALLHWWYCDRSEDATKQALSYVNTFTTTKPMGTRVATLSRKNVKQAHRAASRLPVDHLQKLEQDSIRPMPNETEVEKERREELGRLARRELEKRKHQSHVK